MAVAQAERLGYSHSPPQEDGRKPLYHEALIGFDIAKLLVSDVWIGKNVPRGDGSAVVVIPGFDSKDLDTGILRFWLRRIGYRGHSSGIPFANTDPEYYEESIEKKVDGLFGKVHLVGHSIGGILARFIAAKMPEKIKSVTTLGSPLHGDPEEIVDPFVLIAAKMQIPILRDKKRLAQRIEELAEPLSSKGVRITSIFTRGDGVVDWHSCVDPDPGTDNYEVPGTHAGLIFNRQVYSHLGQILSKPELGVITDL